VLGDYKKMRITSYVFARAARLLYDAWGYEVTQAPPRCGDFEFKGQAKDSWYVVQAKKRRDPRHANLVATQLPSAELAQRGLLLAVLSVVQANSGTVTDTELYRRLHAMRGAATLARVELKPRGFVSRSRTRRPWTRACRTSPTPSRARATRCPAWATWRCCSRPSRRSSTEPRRNLPYLHHVAQSWMVGCSSTRVEE